MNRNWNGNRLAVGGLGLLLVGATILVIKLLLQVAHIIGAGLVLVGLAMIIASMFMRKG